jgi:F-type H+-transporting ATPase subunit alpha
VELLKQDQYLPVAVERQVLVVFAGTNGYTDKLPVDSLKEYEHELRRYVDDKHPDIWEDLRKTRDIGDELKQKIERALKAFGKRFVASKEGGSADDAEAPKPKEEGKKKKKKKAESSEEHA